MEKIETVRELIVALEDMQGNLPVKVSAGDMLDATIVSVCESGDGDSGRKSYVSIICDNADEYETGVLRAFFLHRLPIEAPGYLAQAYTTQDIIDMLEPMVDIGKKKLISYMNNNGYEIHPQLDGIPRWMVYTRLPET